MSHVYYNEIDPFAAAWPRELIREGLIADGTVDERDIRDVAPDELAGFAQCHFFAGIGVWSYALRSAGWPDDRQVWTGSCPCQPFSAAGKQAGTADARHLWPEWRRLIRECRPSVVFGEQVSAAVRMGWLDAVLGDLENEGYACGATVFGAHSVGAPHIRQRLWFVGERLENAELPASARQRHVGRPHLRDEDAVRLARGDVAGGLDMSGANTRLLQGQNAGIVGDPESGRRREFQLERPGPTNGFWREADWLRSRDERWRPVEPGTFPLAHGAPARVGRLRGFGNAIVAPAAQAFIEAYLEARCLVQPPEPCRTGEDMNAAEAKHTPGPWTIGRSADNTPLVMVPVPASEGSGFGVACVNRLPRMGSVLGDVDGNARLIAAAPDMLAALQFVRERITSGFDTVAMVARLDAAIAKATQPTA